MEGSKYKFGDRVQVVERMKRGGGKPWMTICTEGIVIGHRADSVEDYLLVTEISKEGDKVHVKEANEFEILDGGKSPCCNSQDTAEVARRAYIRANPEVLAPLLQDETPVHEPTIEVTCDDTNNTPETMQDKRLNIDVTIKAYRHTPFPVVYMDGRIYRDDSFTDEYGNYWRV